MKFSRNLQISARRTQSSNRSRDNSYSKEDCGRNSARGIKNFIESRKTAKFIEEKIYNFIDDTYTSVLYKSEGVIYQQNNTAVLKYRENESGKMWACKCLPAKLDI